MLQKSTIQCTRTRYVLYQVEFVAGSGGIDIPEIRKRHGRQQYESSDSWEKIGSEPRKDHISNALAAHSRDDLGR